MHRSDLKQKLQTYNEYYKDKPSLQITGIDEEVEQAEWRLEGSLKIHWGIIQPIRFKITDDRNTNTDVLADDVSSRYSSDETSQLELYMNLPHNSNIEAIIESPLRIENQSKPPFPVSTPPLDKATNQVGRSQSSVVMRKNRKRKAVRKRLSIINGHLFSAQTSMFTPTHGSFTNVYIKSLHSSDYVIRLLLNKFKVDNSSSEFCLCVLRSSGETIILKDNHAPLVERVLYGPIEDQVRFCLIEKYRVMDVNEEAAHFFGLPDSVLEAFMTKYMMDEKLEKQMIKEKYRGYKERLEEMMDQLETIS